jgi:hypothetical protein
MTVSQDGLHILVMLGYMDQHAKRLLVDVAESLSSGQPVTAAAFVNAVTQRGQCARGPAHDSPFAASPRVVVPFRRRALR